MFTKSARSLGLLSLPRMIGARRQALRRLNLATKPDLTYLFWESTLRCNLRCEHCGSSCEGTSPLEELSTAEIKRILDTIAEDFDPRRIFISITGGEPLVRKDLYEVVAHMTALGMRSCIVTNGTLLGPEQAARLYEAGMRTVTISVDGLQREHELVRGEGTYARTLAAITHAREAGFNWVEAITCVRPANLGSLAAIERAVKGKGANLWRLITIDQMGRVAGPDEEMWLASQDINRLFDFVAKRRRHYERAKDGFAVRFSCGGFLGLRNEHEVRPEGGQCYAGLAIGSILADGRVGACPSIPREINSQGSARDERFSSIWHRRFEDFRDLEGNRTGICRDCSFFDVCLGGGYHERAVQPRHFCWLDRQDGVPEGEHCQLEAAEVPKRKYQNRAADVQEPVLLGIAALVVFSGQPMELARWYERTLGLTPFVQRDDFVGLSGAGVSIFIQKSGEGHAPGLGGVRPHFRVRDIRALMERLLRAGAREVLPLMETADEWVAAVKDPEGNPLGLLEHKQAS
ncbi:MAG: radical SAM protein [Deltaproteobacteria bacterium]|nr:radical SAM protein [Deltaproteobacteria bacterium]